MTNVKLIHQNSIPSWILGHLDGVFPDTMPRNIELPIEHLRVLQGQRSVIEYLKSLNEDDEEAH